LTVEAIEEQNKEREGKKISFGEMCKKLIGK
jgi:hypothetical protein